MSGFFSKQQQAAITDDELGNEMSISFRCHAALPEVPTQCCVRVSCSAFWGGDEALRQRVSKHGVRTEKFACEKKRKKTGFYHE